MSRTERLMGKVYASVVGAVAAIVAQRLIHGAWKLATGDEPPPPGDPEVPVTEALIWAAASTMGMAVTQVLISRFTANRLASFDTAPATHKKMKITL